MTIPFIKINDVNVRNLNVPHIHTFSYDLPTPVAPGHPRVIDYIGRPIVDIPVSYTHLTLPTSDLV